LLKGDGAFLLLNFLSFFLLSGARQAEMSGVNQKVVTVKKLLEGHYVFKLTVTLVTDDKGLTGTDTVAVNVKKGELSNKELLGVGGGEGGM